MISNSVLSSSITDICAYNQDTGMDAVLSIVLFNSSSTDNITAFLYAVPSGGTASSNTQIASINIPPLETFVWGDKILLANGEKICANAVAGSIIVATVNHIIT